MKAIINICEVLKTFFKLPFEDFMKANKTIYKLLKVFLIAGLYLSFFAVQLFFNFDLANSQKRYSSRTELEHKNDHPNGIALFQKSNFTSKANIRLNKRFEPKSFQVVITPVIEIGLYFYMPQVLGQFSENNFTSNICISAFLRGPPSIA